MHKIRDIVIDGFSSHALFKEQQYKKKSSSYSGNAVDELWDEVIKNDE